MFDVEQRRATRLRVLSMIYEQAGDNTRQLVDLFAIREPLGLTDDEMANAIDYLEQQGLIDSSRTYHGQHTPMHASISHRGVIEMEKSAQSPEQPTDYFPPLNSVVVHIGTVTGSAFQIDSPGATQNSDIKVGGVSVDSAEQIRQFVREFTERLPALRQELTPDAVAEIIPDLETVRVQIDAPKPRKHVVKDCLESIKAVLEHAAGGVIAAGLLGQLSSIHL